MCKSNRFDQSTLLDNNVAPLANAILIANRHIAGGSISGGTGPAHPELHLTSERGSKDGGQGEEGKLVHFEKTRKN
jgi:hypothetical protein